MQSHMASEVMTQATNGVATRSDIAAAAGLGSRAKPATLRVIETCRLSDRVLHLKLSREDGGMFAFRPGQFCRVAVPGAGASVWRSYSIATPAAQDGVSDTCEIAVTAMPGGLATKYLFGLRVGDRIRTSGPFGHFALPAEDPAHYLLIGTGTGMAPYRAMLPELESRAAAMAGALRVTLLIGVRGPHDCLYMREFLDFIEGSSGRRRLLVSYSRTMPDKSARFEMPGYVQEHLHELDLSPQHDHVLLCGNPQMIDTCSSILLAQGFDKNAMTSEKYVAGPAPRQPRFRR